MNLFSINRTVPPRLLLYLLPIIDALLCHIHRIKPIEKDSILRINFHIFRGKSVILPDGTTVSPGERIAEFHLDNKRISQETLNSWHVIDRIRSDLCFLAMTLNKGEFKEFKAFYGRTIHHIAAGRLGFVVREVPPGMLNGLSALFLTALLVAYHPLGKLRLKKGRAPLEMKEVWISSTELLQLYG